MPRTVEFFFDYGSAFSYLADKRLPAIAARTRAMVVYRPMLLGAVLKATRNSSPGAVAAKGAYMCDDLARFARRHGICFKPNPFAFRFNTLHIMRGAVASRRLGVFERYHGAIFDAVWSQRRDLGNDTTFRAVVEAAGIDAPRLFAAIEEDATKDELRRNTEEAVRRDVFGAPTFFVGEEMFWGNDRLEFVESALDG
jgi:2-hydroxychromene-2-carboxylate isomerase